MKVNYQAAWKRALRPQTTSEHWRSLARYWGLSAQAKERLEWLIFYHKVGRKNGKTTNSIALGDLALSAQLFEGCLPVLARMVPPCASAMERAIASPSLLSSI